MSAFQLAQLNIALPREPLDAPLLADFVAELDPVNERADAAPGFVSVAEAEERLALLRAGGPSPESFTFRRHFPPPDAALGAATDDDRDLCPA